MNKFEQLMILTMEEYGELTQACSKKLRKSKTADSLFIEEVGDVLCMIELILEHRLVSVEDIRKRIKVKRKKLSLWSDLIES